MQAFLSSLSKCEEGHNNQTEDWMKQIWDVAYDIEDCIDDFAHNLRACNLCNGGIRFVREQHPNRSIRDMPLQIEYRRELLQRSGRSPDGISSVILVEKDRSFIKSKVVLRIMEYLNLFEIHVIEYICVSGQLQVALVQNFQILIIISHFLRKIQSITVVYLSDAGYTLRWGEQSDDVFDALAGDFMKPRIQEVDQLLKLVVNVTVYNGQAGRILEAGVAASHWWGEQSDDVFNALAGDFMKPRIQEVDQLLKLDVNVTVYSGHVDLIWATKGTMDWVQKLKLDGLNSFLSSPRTPIYCNKEG
ncbi:DCC family protein [Zea mays]|uniref:DCC family protein n=1 Tax=Zea mays TaxID=4577 RepID=A0A3L6DJI9_MAIZE|nr:DCC family protein [Zea mays]